MDFLSPKERSYAMSQVKQSYTKPEILIFNELKKLKLKFKKHYQIEGKPDVAFPKNKIAVFVNGEFWHGRNYKKLKPQLNQYWDAKIRRNMRRDKQNYRSLKNKGWKVLIIWDKDLLRKTQKQISKILVLINNNKDYAN